MAEGVEHNFRHSIRGKEMTLHNAILKSTTLRDTGVHTAAEK
jgi:hypothetical protein